MNRDDFMEFFRSEEGYAELTVDDRLEIFGSVLTGSDDITLELFEKLCADFGTSLRAVIDEQV